MKLVVGLGNIGDHFAGTRHNVGFMALDTFAAAANLTWQHKDKFKARVSEGPVDGQKILLLQPATFYNLSGQAVQAAKHFYQLDNIDIVIVHDELALPLGTVRARWGGSDAGNNGIKSVAAAIGGDFARIRVGIANDVLARTDASDFVLSRFSRQEHAALQQVQQHALDLIYQFIRGDFTHTTKAIE